MSFDYDVTIIGAGPIGSTLAYELSKEDINVCLIDKKKVIGLPLQCAGIINKKVLDINQFPEELILNKVKGAILHSKTHSLSVSKEEDQAIIIDRVALDQFLYNRAIDNGAHSIIVGADGPLSIVSSAFGNDLKFYCASQYLVKVDEDNDQMSFVDLYAYGDLFPGFIWQIPVNKNTYRIGMFSTYDYKRQNEILDDFLENDFRYNDYEIIEKYKGKIPIYNKNNKLFKNRGLLIGDAASQIKPTTGGGLLIGFEAVEMAKKAIVKALNSEDFNSINHEKETNDDSKILQDSLKSYQKDFEKRFLKEFSYQFKVQKTLCTLSDEDLDYFFEKLKEKEADKLISEYGDMDNQSILVKEFLKRGLVLSLLPAIHKKELAKIWLL